MYWNIVNVNINIFNFNINIFFNDNLKIFNKLVWKFIEIIFIINKWSVWSLINIRNRYIYIYVSIVVRGLKSKIEN